MDTTPSVSPLRLLDDRATRLFVALAAFFCANAVLADKYMAMATASLGAEIAATLAVQPQAKPGAAAT